jgi:hypothetical protein
MRKITGKELERELLKTQGRTWDEVHGSVIEQVDATRFRLVYIRIRYAFGMMVRCLLNRAFHILL